MFRDEEQRMLVIQTLLGVVGHANWVEGEEYSEAGQNPPYVCRYEDDPGDEDYHMVEKMELKS